MPTRWWRALLAGSVALIAAATLLPFAAPPSVAPPPRWCLACGGPWAADAVSNVLLFAPLGVALALGGRRWLPVTALGALLSLLVEGAQALGVPPARSPALADLLANTLGATLGWWLAARGPTCWQAHGRTAGAWGAGWWLAASGVMVATAAAEQRGGAEAPTAVRTSGTEYAPGYGWYGGTPLDAVVAAPREEAARQPAPWTLYHSGSGPIVAESDQMAQLWRVTARIVSRDTLTYRRAVVFLHLPHDTTAELVIAQHDRAAELLVRRRARAWGLTFPMVTLASAFPAAPGADTVTLEATAAPGYLRLRGGTGGRVDSAQVALTPLLGWAMLQTPVAVQHPLAPLVHVGWLACLLVPIGWWSGRSGRRRVVLFAWGASAASLLEVSRLLAVAPVPSGDLLLGLTMLATSAIAGWRSAARHPGFARG